MLTSELQLPTNFKREGVGFDNGVKRLIEGGDVVANRAIDHPARCYIEEHRGLGYRHRRRGPRDLVGGEHYLQHHRRDRRKHRQRSVDGLHVIAARDGQRPTQADDVLGLWKLNVANPNESWSPMTVGSIWVSNRL